MAEDKKNKGAKPSAAEIEARKAAKRAKVEVDTTTRGRRLR